MFKTIKYGYNYIPSFAVKKSKAWTTKVKINLGNQKLLRAAYQRKVLQTPMKNRPRNGAQGMLDLWKTQKEPALPIPHHGGKISKLILKLYTYQGKIILTWNNSNASACLKRHFILALLLKKLSFKANGKLILLKKMWTFTSIWYEVRHLNFHKT